jgi:hypothetical protein
MNNDVVDIYSLTGYLKIKNFPNFEIKVLLNNIFNRNDSLWCAFNETYCRLEIYSNESEYILTTTTRKSLLPLKLKNKFEPFHLVDIKNAIITPQLNNNKQFQVFINNGNVIYEFEAETIESCKIWLTQLQNKRNNFNKTIKNNYKTNELSSCDQLYEYSPSKLSSLSISSTSQNSLLLLDYSSSSDDTQSHFNSNHNDNESLVQCYSSFRLNKKAKNNIECDKIISNEYKQFNKEIQSVLQYLNSDHIQQQQNDDSDSDSEDNNETNYVKNHHISSSNLTKIEKNGNTFLSSFFFKFFNLNKNIEQTNIFNI